MIYLVEIQAAVDAAGTIEYLRFGSEGFVTQPTDNPANTFYEDRLMNVGAISRFMFGNNTTGGQSEIGYGFIQLSNPDGGLDVMRTYGFDSRSIRVLIGERGAAYSTFTVLLFSTMEQVEFTFNSVSVKIKDSIFNMAKPLCATRYAGNNALPLGEEGRPEDIKGQPKPRLYGTAYNMSAICVNTSKLIYQIHDGAIQSVAAVYDKGASLTVGAVYTSIADMEANAPGASTYRVYAAGGYFRLGSTPQGTITVDASQGATAADRTVAQILKRIATDAGIPSISESDVTALDVLNSAEVGVWVSDDADTVDVMDEVAQSIGAYYLFDAAGTMRMGQLDLPIAPSVATLDDTNIIDIDLVRSDDAGRGLPSYRITLNYAKNYTVQTSDLAGIAATRLAYAANEYRTTKAEDTSVQTQYPLSPEIVRYSLLITEAAAIPEAARLLVIYKTRRDTYKVRVRLEPAIVSLLDLNQVITLTLNRFDLAAGKLMRIIGIETDFSRNKATLTVWG
jgi:hypothetical protein